MARRIATALVALLAAIPFAAHGQATVAMQGSLVEHYAAAATISAQTAIGLVVSGEIASELPLRAAIPRHWAGRLICARVVTADGRYEAQQEYLVPDGWPGGAAAMEYPTAFRAQLAALAWDELSVMVRGAPCADAAAPEAAEITLGSWTGALGGEVNLLVNSARADEAYLILEDGTDISCEPLRDVQRTAYDTRCVFDLAALSGSGTTTIELNRIRQGAILPGLLLIIVRVP